MTISNNDDIIDSRDIIERIEELESDYNDLIYDRDEAETDDERADAKAALQDWLDDNNEELTALKALQEEAKDYAPDWHYGATLVRESYFTEYAQELCEDIGSIPADCPAYIRNNIDWDGVADDLKVDYTKVDFDGVTYLVR